MNTIEVAIFSFNRGEYLKNCIESIERNMPSVHYHVFDDGSDDPTTCAYLKTLGSRVTLTHEKIAKRHGGFYSNMQAAVSNATAEYLILLQEDMQVVREVTDEDLVQIRNIFEYFGHAAFLSPVFLKGRKRDLFETHYSPAVAVPAYVWHEASENVVPACYTDVAVVCPKRLKTSGWSFQDSEMENGRMAKHLFGLMPQMANPFCFYLPEEPAFRGRVLTLGAKLAFKLTGGNIKRFVDMSPESFRLLSTRNLSIMPFAEDFIETQDPKVTKPFKFNGYRTSWVTIFLNKVELLVRRLL